MLNKQELEELCFLCFEALESKLDKRPLPTPPEKFDRLCYPLFVTWHTISKENGKASDGQLRGCIGTFNSSGKLGRTAIEYSIISAFKDSRFPPITSRELPDLDCKITLLHDFSPMKDINDFKIGRDGVRLSISHSLEGEISSCFLPDVIADAGWDHEETLRNLIIKAGVDPNKLKKDEIDSIELEKYQGTACNATYSHYLKYKHK